jgi:hypothetical protein
VLVSIGEWGGMDDISYYCSSNDRTRGSGLISFEREEAETSRSLLPSVHCKKATAAKLLLRSFLCL